MGEYSYKVEQSSDRGQDRAIVFEVNGCIILLLADGAGDRKGAGQISEKYLELMTDCMKNNSITSDPLILEQIMRDIDTELLQHSNGSETTAVITIIKDAQVWGASVGDSRCWIFNKKFDYELTTNQYRKPLLGSGQAIPVGFGPFDLNGFIVAGSDGLFNYTSIDKINEKLFTVPFDKSTEAIIDLVRLPSGGLHDDCSVIIYKT